MITIYQYEVIGPGWIIYEITDEDYYPLPGGEWQPTDHEEVGDD